MGPLYINDANAQSEDKQEKVYVCLFTCAMIRVVHLELNRTQRHLLWQFTSQWRKEYLLSLRETHKTIAQSKGGSSISVIDVVVLKDNTKRMFWRLAIVEELLTGPDGQVCAAAVRVGKSGRQGQLF